MADFAESLAKDALKVVKNVYSSITNYKGNLKLLHDNIHILGAKKADIVRKVEDGELVLEEVTNEASVWLQNVKALLEDEEVNDLLNDDLIRAKDQCCFGLFLCNLCQRYGMSRLAKSKVDEIKEKLGQLPQDPVTVPKRSMDLDPIPSEHCKGLESRGMVEKRILELLKDDQVDAVGICGMGGIGKTILTKEIKNKGAKDMFDAIFMVEMSQEVNIKRIQDHIAASMDLCLDSKHPLKQRATKLYNALKEVKPKGNKNDQQTKILIIMDNIWADLKLDQLGIPFERTPQFCCKLLFTSREKSVCKSMGVPNKNIVDVSMLGEDESRLLFWEQVKNVDGNIVEKSLEERLLRSCGGLPLAIVTLAKSLSGQHVSIWQHFAHELEKPISCRSDNLHYDAAYKIIEASYNFIGNNDKKMFFLLACLYPSGLRISVEDLMRYDIGLNLFKHADSLTQVIEQANIWTNELISSSLLLDDDDDGYGLRKAKVHDVVRSSTILCAEKAGQKMMVESIPQWQLDNESWEKYTAISLTTHKDHSRLTGMPFDLLETLILTASCHFEPGDHDDLFQGMPRLKVLQLSRLESRLPKSITTLIHLRTLHLEDCILEDGDMEMVSELVGLLVLSLRGSDVKMLPYEIKNLNHLRLLDLNECTSLTTIPGNVLRSLTQLEGLYMVNSYESRWQDNSSEMEQGTTASVAEIRSLHRLKVLQIQVERIEQVTLSDIQFITSIQNFKFYAHLDDGKMKNMVFSGVNFEVKIGDSFEWLREYPCLKALFERSKHVEIEEISDNEGLVKNVVPNLDGQGFQILEELRLYNLKGLNKICDGQAPDRMFFNLQILKLKRLENLESYVVPIDVATNLTTLSVDYCEKLKFIWKEHVAPFTKKELPCLKYLKLDTLPNLLQALGNDDNVTCSTSIEMNKPQAVFNANKIVFPSLEELVIGGGGMYNKLVEWDIPNPMPEISPTPSLHFSPFPNLRKLFIEDANNMKTGIGSPSIAATLVHLESLQIQFCEKMKKVISEETEEIEILSNFVISFPKLHFLDLSCLDELECMYGGNYKVDFPTLKKIELYDLPNMTRFIGPENTLFINLRCLTLLRLEQLDSYVLLVDTTPNLTQLKVWDCKKVKYTWMENVTQKERYELPCLKVLRLVGVDNLIQALGNDNVNISNKLQPLFNNKTVFPSLEELKVNESNVYNKLVEWEISATPSPHFSPFPNLRKLYISNAHNMKIGIGSPYIAATLVHLETLIIRRCKKMKKVISEETEEETQISSNIIITFPKLHSLMLSGLDELECIYGGRYKVEFPALKKMKLCDAPNMTRFVGPGNTDDGLLEKVEFPASLEELTLSEEPPRMMNSYSSFQTLRVLNLEHLNGMHAFSEDMVATIGLTQLHHLEQLNISNCKNMEAVVEEIDDEAITSSSSFNLEFPRLTTIRLDGCDKMRWFFSTRHAHIILNMPSLQQVSIKECNDMELFSNGPIKVPKLAKVEVKRSFEGEDFKMPDGGDLNKFIHDFCKSFHPRDDDNKQDEKIE